MEVESDRYEVIIVMKYILRKWRNEMYIKIKDIPGKLINENMIGLFFEDINYGLDGGLHAEMIENRSFEFVEAYGYDKNYHTRFAGGYGWSNYTNREDNSKIVIASSDSRGERSPHYLIFQADNEGYSFSNKAYDGICMKAYAEYQVSIYAKADKYNGDITVSIVKDKEIMASGTITLDSQSGWREYTIRLMSEATITYGDFVITLENIGTVCFDFISMLPSNAVLGLFRRDLIEKLEQIKPGFLRFPGGCVVEGANLSNSYRWKDGNGKKEERRSNWNRWAVHDNSYTEGEKIRYPYYNQSMGIGFYEYFLLSEYIGAKPLPILNVGVACQFQSDEKVNINDSKFMEYIQDALDLIEFANGDTHTPWGRLRMEMGHAEPFGLEMLGVGNEQWETKEIDFYDRYRLFEREIHKKYPNIKLIGTAGPDITSEKYSSAWDFYYSEIEKNPDFVYAVDEHYYMHPDWFKSNTHFYDNYPRKIKVFAGEYAAHYSNGMNRPELNNWGAALAEAAFLTGLERNADVVVFASYAPLLARKGFSQWSPDLIWFDGTNSYGTPSYYIQQLFGSLKGKYTLKTEFDSEEVNCSISFDEKNQAIYIKLVNTDSKKKIVNIDVDFDVLPYGEIVVMKGKKEEGNSLENPYHIIPLKQNFTYHNNKSMELLPESFYVITLNRKVNNILNK